eukprot:4016434-Prymnesium_polylepis.1
MSDELGCTTLNPTPVASVTMPYSHPDFPRSVHAARVKKDPLTNCGRGSRNSVSVVSAANCTPGADRRT